MPANLTPQYLEAERRYRAAKSVGEKLTALEEMLAVMPKHKGTDKLKASLRRRMADLQERERKGGGRRGHDPYLIRREGAGQVALWGLPNSGKSSLLAALTHARPAVGDYPFATREPLPGMMSFEDVQVQLVDLPPLTDEASAAWLPRVLGRADAVACVVDAAGNAPLQLGALSDGLAEQELPAPAAGSPRGDFQGFVCLARADLCRDLAAAVISLEPWGMPVVPVSALAGTGLEEFRRAAFRSLRAIRVYTKAPHERADRSAPVVLPEGATVEMAARSIHKEFAERLRYARVWGKGLHEGQMAAHDHVLQDGDLVEFHLRP